MPSDKGTCADKPEVAMVTGEDGAVVRLSGPIDIDSSPAVLDRLLRLFEAPPANAVSIDLSAVTHIDSSGLATLIEALRIARSHNTEVKLQGLEGRLLCLFQSTGILSLFDGSTRTNVQSGAKVV